MSSTLKRIHDRFVLWRAARNRDPDVMLCGIQSEFERLCSFLDSAAPNVASHLREHVEFDRDEHRIRYTGGPFSIRLRRGA
jgi:hypothetical protein